MSSRISEATTNRLSVYLRCLNELDAAGVRAVSSKALAEQFDLTVSQVRNRLRAVRKELMDQVKKEIRDQVTSEADYREEARMLFGLDP